ncbi:MAG: BatD [Myxococcaceae bacterium]|nr:BatD [Myxococcaceae bacterium]
MARIGSALALLLVASPAAADVEFYQTVDRDKVGTEDTFRLTIVVAGAPDGATVQFPAPADLEVLSRTQSTQMSYSIGSAGTGNIKHVQKYTLVMRANRTGTLTIPAAVLSVSSRSYKTEALKIEVTKGRTTPPPQAQAPRTAFPPPFGGDPFGMFPEGEEPEIPRSDSDLFLRATIDKEEVYLGEQVTLALVIYSRSDLSSVDSVTMPKLEGFWSEDIESPTQLSPEQKTIGGVPYRAYLLRRRALFPVKSGTVTIDAAEADITTGYLFAGHRVHRRGNPLTLKVKPLPKGGSTTNVGRWRLATEVSQSKIALGEPVQVKVILEGKGNLKNAIVPPLTGPSSLKIYEPQTADRLTSTKGTLGGRRTMEYVVLPQQTGTFTLPGLGFSFFNPETKKFEDSKTDPITLTVTPGAGGSTVVTVPNSANPDPTLKNQLVANGLKSLRHTGNFRAPAAPLFSHPLFLPFALAPLGLTLGFGLFGFARRTLSKNDPVATRRRQAKAARARLAQAVKIQRTGKTADFYSEVEKALVSFLEAKLSAPVTGLQRSQLDALMAHASVTAEIRGRVIAVLETCDMGRFAPGMGEAAARSRALDDAAAAMGAWDTR